MEFLIRFVQIHENFRRPEIEALAAIAQINVEFLFYSECSPYGVVRLNNEAAARALINRSISSKGIYELWGSGTTYEELHKDVQRRSAFRWAQYSSSSFRFDFDTFQGTRSASEQSRIIESFSYLNLNGPIQMNSPSQIFCIFENYPSGRNLQPCQIHLGRYLAPSQRQCIWSYSLKRRVYISTTSMDSELALLSANLTLAGPGKIFYDPFVGTGSFPIACAHFGAITMGSDLDGRALRGKDGVNVEANFKQYKLLDRWLDGFVADMTHSPLRAGRFLDGIICDPPYGVREGLKVLGSRDSVGPKKEELLIDGRPAHLHPSYIPPRKPYNFDLLLADILHFAACSLVDNGRLSLWMPTANADTNPDNPIPLTIPTHPQLHRVSCCVQPFRKWSRYLLTYQRIPSSSSSSLSLTAPISASSSSLPAEQDAQTQPRPSPPAPRPTANDLNDFRRRYFEGFRTATSM